MSRDKNATLSGDIVSHMILQLRNASLASHKIMEPMELHWILFEIFEWDNTKADYEKLFCDIISGPVVWLVIPLRKGFQIPPPPPPQLSL